MTEKTKPPQEPRPQETGFVVVDDLESTDNCNTEYASLIENLKEQYKEATR